MDAVSRYVFPELERWHAPGIELAVVADGDVAYAGGFGVTDLTSRRPVTSKTLFHHGSTAKAFTGVVAASLVGEGLLAWDRPVRDYLPDLRLHDPVATERVTLVDLLAHRSGLAQHEWAWLAHPSETGAELSRRLRYLEPAHDLRVAFQYCNLGYVLAGQVIGAVTRSSWEEQLRTRVLEPLGMNRTFTSLAAAQADADHATPHDERDGAAVGIPWRASDGIGPAGGILSCAEDTARWMLFQLGDGTLEGARVLTEPLLRESQRTHFPFESPGASPEVAYTGYGLGWVQGTYRGRRLIWHNGGVDGFKTEIVLLPDEGIGVATCATASYTSLFPQAVAYHVADVLLEEEPKPWSAELRMLWLKQTAAQREEDEKQEELPNTVPSHPISEYAGTYEHPGYGLLDVTASEGGELRFTLGELAFSSRHRHFDTWTIRYEPLATSVPVTFLTEPGGNVYAAEAPLEGGVTPIRFVRTDRLIA